MTDSALAYAEWHQVALKQLLAGARPTTKSLIDGRGGGSATTATAALREFHEIYLPDLLSAATLGAPPELHDLAAETWRRLAAAAREAAGREWDKERATQAVQAERSAAALAATQAHARELEQRLAELAATLREREALTASLKEQVGAQAGELAAQRTEAAELGRALAQAHRERDQLDGALARTRSEADERKEILQALQHAHAAALGQHAADLERLAGEHAARVDRIEADHALRMERLETTQAEALARAATDRETIAGELAAERKRHERARVEAEQRIEALREAGLRAESARDSHAATAQAERALRVPLEARIQDLVGERERLLAQVAAERERVVALTVAASPPDGAP